MSRASKYAKKIDSEVIKNRIDSQKESMVDQQRDYFPSAVEVEVKVKDLLDGESNFKIVYYIIFAKEIQKIIKKHGGGRSLIGTQSTMYQELEIMQEKWLRRGLDPEKLTQVKLMLVPNYPIYENFILDDSLLDGSDRLA